MMLTSKKQSLVMKIGFSSCDDDIMLLSRWCLLNTVDTYIICFGIVGNDIFNGFMEWNAQKPQLKYVCVHITGFHTVLSSNAVWFFIFPCFSRYLIGNQYVPLVCRRKRVIYVIDNSGNSTIFHFEIAFLLQLHRIVYINLIIIRVYDWYACMNHVTTGDTYDTV